MKSAIMYSPLFGLMALGLTAPVAHADPSVPFPTYSVGPQPDGSYVVSTGQVITPAGTQVNLGSPVRAKAVALNPITATHTAAVLQMASPTPVQVFNTQTGVVVQSYVPFGDYSGSYGGITYSADGQFLFFSQDSSYLAIAKVGENGILSDYAHVKLPATNAFINCDVAPPVDQSCGQLYSNGAIPGGIAVSRNGRLALVLLNQNNALGFVDLTQPTPVLTQQIRVGNAPNSIVLVGNSAYVSNEGGRVATSRDFTNVSAGTPIVADKVSASAITGTVSVVDLATRQLVKTINVGLHPTGLAVYGDRLLVANTYSDTISVIDTTTNKVERTISLAVPMRGKPYGAGPTGLTVDAKTGLAYVTLFNANAVAVVDLAGDTAKPVLGYIPVGFAPASIVLDKAGKTLIVSSDKGVGARGNLSSPPSSYNSHYDTGTVNIIKLPTLPQLNSWTVQVVQNNHWDLKQNVNSAGNGSPLTPPVAIPAHIGDPSLIKHVFLFVRENRTYDQILGDVTKGDGDPSLALGATVTPNAHALVQRFPLLDNFYDPSRQSADGHPWLMQALAPYADEIQSPDWNRSYPYPTDDALVYTRKGYISQSVAQAGLKVKLYGEGFEYYNWPAGEPSWSQLYADALAFEAGQETTLKYQTADITTATVPSVSNYLMTNYPPFDLNVPDQWRVDWWVQDFNNDMAAGTVPALTILYFPDDHTGGPPTAVAQIADNDLAIGRAIDYISHSSIWSSSAIFMEEDDAQAGLDHVDGHRSPGYIVSPYAVQNATAADHTYYSQVNVLRTIEQILGVPPFNQYDMVASPMYTAFTNTPNFAPWDHVANEIPLNQGTTASLDKMNPLEKAWQYAKVDMFKGKLQKPDSVDPYTLNHYIWYAATHFQRPYPGEMAVRPPSEFASRLAHPNFDLNGDQN
jgi:YVTN family beta-propeller protein